MLSHDFAKTEFQRLVSMLSHACQAFTHLQLHHLELVELEFGNLRASLGERGEGYLMRFP